MKLDIYSLKARLYPAIIVLLPVLLMAFYYVVAIRQYYHLITALLSVGLFSYLLAQLGRDLGKKYEKELFESWGGKPSTQLLQHGNAHLDKYTKVRYYKLLEDKISGLLIPTAQQEANDPGQANMVYESCVRFLLSQTRDTVKYSLLFKENINYGFRRNLWGMKNLALSIIGLCILVHSLILYNSTSFSFISAQAFGMYGVLLLIALFWMIIVTQDWVKLTSFAYAERLFESLERL